MIERRGYSQLLQSSRRDNPLILWDERAYLECGCSGFVGIRLDKNERATMLRACSKRHDRLVGIAQEALVVLLREDPELVPMVEVVDELLTEAERIAG